MVKKFCFFFKKLLLCVESEKKLRLILTFKPIIAYRRNITLNQIPAA